MTKLVAADFSNEAVERAIAEAYLAGLTAAVEECQAVSKAYAPLSAGFSVTSTVLGQVAMRIAQRRNDVRRVVPVK